jgi:D-threo-aldose 1-dehydrogenase
VVRKGVRGLTQDTLSLGLGCASLYGLPEKRDRRALLDAAYDLGIRHFDVAPMYGLGVAEAELGQFRRTHADISIGTKFGIRPTALGRIAGAVQAPIRRVLQRSSSVKSKVKQSGAGPADGGVGRLLYTPHDFSVASAKLGLASSLRALGTDRIDYFLVHEPAGVLGSHFDDLVDYLESERRTGTIGHWGPAGSLSVPDPDVAKLTERATVVQSAYDALEGYHGPAPGSGQASITYGFLAKALPVVQDALDGAPQLRAQCNELLGADLSNPATIVTLLIRDALSRNPEGTVLFSTTKIQNLQTACAAAQVEWANVTEVVDSIRDRCLHTRVDR